MLRSMPNGYYSIYTIRLGLTGFYDYRISTLQANLNSLQKQRDTTLDKLKAATKYNSTQQLLEKYGDTSPRSKSSDQPHQKTFPSENAASGAKTGRTGFAPPATANIPGRNVPASLPNTPQRLKPVSTDLGRMPPFTAAALTPPWQQTSPIETTAEFAPSAFSAAPQYIQTGVGPKWYDRFVDLLLGEDESSPKNRIVLLCKSCRLVNGQAPPGIMQLEDVGKWRCSGCGTMNGEETEAKKLVAEIKKQAASGGEAASVNLELRRPISASDEEAVLIGRDEDRESDVTQYSDNELEVLQEDDAVPNIEEEAEPEKPKRGRPKGSGKKRSYQ